MQRDRAQYFIELGERIHDCRIFWDLDRYFEVDPNTNERSLTRDAQRELGDEFTRLLIVAKRLELPLSMKALGRCVNYANNLPTSAREFDMLVELMKDELDEKLFLFIPQHLAIYYERDDLLSEIAKTAFPLASTELRSAGNAIAASLPTAAVFHSVRALEHGLRALARDVQLTFDVQQWANIIDQIERKIEEIRKNGIPNTGKVEKSAKLQFLSESAKEFAYFKDGWRNYVAHAKVPYSEQQAVSALNHVRAFIERLSGPLKE